MTYTLRPKQVEACDLGLDFLLNRQGNGVMYEPTAFGKSLVIGTLAVQLSEHPQGGPVLISQPSKELLDQNYEKIRSYGFDPAVYSATKRRQQIDQITLVTIGSIWKRPELFQDFRYMLIDECHLWNPKEGMFNTFQKQLPHLRLLGLSASPWRMYSNSRGTELRFITRTRPKVFAKLIHYTQVQELVADGYWAKLEYFPMAKKVGFDSAKLEPNQKGSEYSDGSVQLHLFSIGFDDRLVEIVNRVAAKRRNVLVFCSSVEQANYVVERVPGAACVTGETPDDLRDPIVRGFKSGHIKIVVNVGVFIHGFDYPELECVVDAAPTLSLSRYYQKLGRGVRVHPDKESCWIVDLVDNYRRFGPIEDLRLYCEGTAKWAVWGKPGGGAEKQLTNVYFDTGRSTMLRCQQCQSTDVFFMRHETTKKAAMLSRPPAGTPAKAVVREVEGKKVWAYPKPCDEDRDAAEFVLHRTVCRGGKG